MRKMAKCLLYFLIITLSLLIIHVPVTARVQTSYPYIQYLQYNPYILFSSALANPLIWMPQWSYSYSLGGRMNPVANPLNYAYLYFPFNPDNPGGKPSWTFPWRYFVPASPKLEPEKSPFEDPVIIKMGGLKAQLFEPYRYLFIADYTGADIEVRDEEGHGMIYDSILEIMLDPDHFITDPNEIAAYWISLGADPNKFITDREEWKSWWRYPYYEIDAEPDPNISALMGRDFTVDPHLPIFADPNLRLGGATARRLIDQGRLDWDWTILDFDPNEIQSALLKPLPVYPYDGMPTYLPTYHSALESIDMYGKPYFNPTLVFFLETSLWNAGFTEWPNIASLDYTPQYFNDLIVQINVSNGIDSDAVTFPFSVVNYPVENYAPVPQVAKVALTGYVGEELTYAVKFIDPDCFIFSMSPAPATTHTPAISGSFRTDMDGLTWGMRINGLPCYDYGQSYQIIDSCSGLINWIPKFESNYEQQFYCADAREGTAVVEITFNIRKRSDN